MEGLDPVPAGRCRDIGGHRPQALRRLQGNVHRMVAAVDLDVKGRTARRRLHDDDDVWGLVQIHHDGPLNGPVVSNRRHPHRLAAERSRHPDGLPLRRVGQAQARTGNEPERRWGTVGGLEGPESTELGRLRADVVGQVDRQRSVLIPARDACVAYVLPEERVDDQTAHRQAQPARLRGVRGERRAVHRPEDVSRRQSRVG